MTLFDIENVYFSGSVGSTNNTTPVVMVPDPGTGTPAIVIDTGCLGVLNRDTTDKIIIIKITGASIIIEQFTLTTGYSWANPSKIPIQPGQTLTIELSDTVTTNQPTWHIITVQRVA